MSDHDRHHQDPPDRRPPPRTGALAWLARLNPTTVVLTTLLLMLGVVLLPGPIGAALALAIAGGLGWLLHHTWPVLPTNARVMRLLVIALLVLIAVSKLLK